MREDKQKQKQSTARGRVTRRSGTKLFGAAPREQRAERIRAFDEDNQQSERDDHRDRRDYRDERRDYRDERRDYRDERRDYRDERRDYRDERRDYRDERRDYRDERRDYRDERHDYRDERRDYRDDRRDYRDDREEARDTRRETRESTNERARAPRREKKASTRVAKPTDGQTELFAHQVIPYVMFWVALFAAVSFILRDLAGLSASAGAFGNWLADFLCRLLGIGAYVLPLFLCVLALRWKRFVREGILGKKIFLSAAFLLLLSGIIHVFQDLDRARCMTEPAALLSAGQELVGGGLLGGFVGEWLGFCLRLPGTCLLAIPLLVIIGIYLVGLTPSVLYQRINAKMQMNRARRREERGANGGGLTAAPARAALGKGGEGAEPAWKKPQPLSHGAVYDFGEKEDDEIIDDAEPLSEQEKVTASEDPLPTSEKQPKRRNADVLEILDIPDDEPEIVETSAPTAPPATTPEARAAANRTVEALLRDMTGETGTAAAAPTAPQTLQTAAKDTASYYAPFALPVRPEPKRARAEAPDHSHIVIAPHAQNTSTAVSDTYAAETPAAPAASVATPAQTVGEEETLGNIRQTPYVPTPAAPFTSRPAAATVPSAQSPSYVTATSAPSPVKPVAESVAPVMHTSTRGDIGSLADLFEEEPADDGAADAQSVLDELFGTPTPAEDIVTDIDHTVTAADDIVAPVSAVREPYTATAPTTAPAADDFEDDGISQSVQDAAEDDYFDFGTVRETPAAPAAPTVEVRRESVAPQSVPAAPSFTPPVQQAVPVRVARPVVQQAPVKDTPPPAPEVPPREYMRPPISLLNEDKNVRNDDFYEEIEETKDILRNTLESFNIHIQDEIAYSHGPSITRYELRPVAGTSVRSVTNRQDDISLNLASSVRIEAPIPGKPAIGVEVPNKVRETVYMRTMLESAEYKNSTDPLEVPLGLDVGGSVRMCNLVKMPHLLVAGTTGSGKSVCINSILVSLIYKTSPKDLRLILIDPKQIEFAPYEHVPHLYMPIVTDMQRAAGALACAVQEMERRFQLIKDVGVRNIESYNAAVANDPDREHLPYMIIVIDEFADLKMSCSNNDPENFTCRLAQKARAAGIHLIIGTQRPSVDVITGKLKTNIPSRIAFMVKQQVDSRTILDVNGAEALTGRGDMLYMATNSQDKAPVRIQGAFVSDGELDRVISFVRKNNDPVQYNQAFMDQIEIEMAKAQNNGKKADFDDFGDDDDSGEDPKFVEAVKLAIDTQKVATSLLQRRLGVGYGRAAKIIDRMEELGLVSASEGNKPRQILPAAQGYLNHLAAEDEGDTDDFNDYS